MPAELFSIARDFMGIRATFPKYARNALRGILEGYGFHQDGAYGTV